MSMDEFDSYVKDAYEEAESLDVVTEEYVSEESSSLDVAPLASIAYYQKYFYNSGNTNNYLYVRAYVILRMPTHTFPDELRPSHRYHKNELILLYCHNKDI